MKVCVYIEYVMNCWVWMMISYAACCCVVLRDAACVLRVCCVGAACVLRACCVRAACRNECFKR